MWKLLWLGVIYIINQCSKIEMSHLQHKITFPHVEQYNQCYVDQHQTVKGVCKRLSECPSAVERWHNQKIQPQTCYFEKLEQVVCCDEHEVTTKSNVVDPSVKSKRRSEIACSNSVFKVKRRNLGLNVPFIIRGLPTKYKEHPYMAALGWKANFGDTIVYHCGGVLISPTFVLTAAHCAERGGELPIVVRTGGVNLTDPDILDINIKRIIVHPEYNAANTYNDIALIELEKNSYDRGACIWPTHDLKYDQVTAIGYGHTRFAGGSSVQLLKATLQIVTQAECNKYYRDELSNGIIRTQICAKDPEKIRDTCQGDSGGPIIMEDNQLTEIRRYVVGITSYGLGCANDPPGVYTRVAAFIDWIEDIVWPA